MTHPFLVRGHLEALLIAHVIVRPGRAPLIVRRVDRDRISVAAWALLAQLGDTPDARRAAGVMFPDNDTVYTRTKAQVALADRVDAITIADLCFFDFEIVLGLVNQLPERAHQEQAWERDLAIATERVA